MSAAEGRTPTNAAPTARDVDVIVVGAGPAGSCAALVAARAGLRVVLLERGPFPGSKNMFGGVVYPRILDTLLPNWWDDAPVQRWVTRRTTMLLTDHQALSVDFRTQAWAAPPYNGATTLRPEWDRWLAGHAEAAGAQLLCSTTVTGLLRDGQRVVGVRTDRPEGDLTAHLVIACDGVNSFLAKEAGLYEQGHAEHYTLGVKETLALPREVIEQRFQVRDLEGVDIEILGGTGDVHGGAFLYTNLDSLSVGVVLKVPQLATQQRRPEEIIAELTRHPAIAPLVEGGELVEYSAHLIPEAGVAMMPKMVTDGMLVAGDAAALCLAAGVWLEGVNFAMASGMYAGETAVDAIGTGTADTSSIDTSATGLAGYQTRLSESFVLRDHRKLHRAPALVLSDRVQRRYPQMIANSVERMFRVDNPAPKPGLRRILRDERKGAGVKLRQLARDGWAAIRTFG